MKTQNGLASGNPGRVKVRKHFLTKGRMVLICTLHNMPVGRNNVCIPCAWAAREK